MSEQKQSIHYCSIYGDEPNEGWIRKNYGGLEHRQYGMAVTTCFEDEDGRLFVENGEYESQVNFCPYCGFKAVVQVPK